MVVVSFHFFDNKDLRFPFMFDFFAPTENIVDDPIDLFVIFVPLGDGTLLK